MGREVRRVPADWEHQKEWKITLKGYEEEYKPLSPGEDYQVRVDEWDEECSKWKLGEFPDYAGENDRKMAYEQWAGQRPHKDDYMPNWPLEQRTHFMMYEDTSEGTPISPAFETPEELATWLFENNASAFGNMTASYEGWLRVAQGGFACSAVFSENTGIVSGVDGLTNMNES
jgi:hypothetical protein